MKRIKSIEIKNSRFYNGDLKVEFSEKLNCIMGGRGTGKSTLMYFILSSLNANSEEDSMVYNILKNNLGDGTILIEFETSDSTIYSISKLATEEPQPYILPGQKFVTIDSIENEVECDIYEAGKIEQIGRNSQDRLALIDKKIKLEVSEILGKIRKIQIDLEGNAQDIKSFNKRLLQVNEIMSQYDRAEEEFDAHRKIQPVGIDEKDKEKFEKADFEEKARKDEQRFFQKTFDVINKYLRDIKSNTDDVVGDLQRAIAENEVFYNKELIDPSIAEVSSLVRGIKSTTDSQIKELEGVRDKLQKASVNLSEKHTLQQADFIKLKQKFELNKEYINKYNTLSKKVNEKTTLKKDISEFALKRDKLKAMRVELIKELNASKQQLATLRINCINELNAKFAPEIRITLTFGGITDSFEEKLRNSLKGSGMRYNELVPRIVQNFAPDQFAGAIQNQDIDALKNIAGIDEVRSKALITALIETEAIYDIEALYCPDLPEFLLKVNDSETLEECYKKTDELSMGQRCTTVLPIIFGVSNNPLIIDQPEDNLDNRYITEKIHEIIRDQKEHRQLIFITHNPNIPVLSEAEKNIFLAYSNLRAFVDSSGTVADVKDKIITILEGGEKAFKKRSQIYGF